MDSLLRNQFETMVLPFRVSRVGLEKQGHGGEPVAFLVGQFPSEFQQERHPGVIQRFARSQNRSRRGPCSHVVEAASRLNFSLQAGSIKGMVHIGCAKAT